MRYVVWDMDGVLADFSLMFTQWAVWMNFINPFQVRSHGSRYDFDDLLTDEQLDAVWDAIKASSTAWFGTPELVTEADKHAMHKLSGLDIGHIYLTARPGTDVVEQTEAWLAKNGFPAGLVVADSKKAEYLSTVDGKIIGVIDDTEKQIKRIHQAGFPVWVRDWPYNRHVLPGLPRSYSVHEFVDQVLDASRD